MIYTRRLAIREMTWISDHNTDNLYHFSPVDSRSVETSIQKGLQNANESPTLSLTHSLLIGTMVITLPEFAHAWPHGIKKKTVAAL